MSNYPPGVSGNEAGPVREYTADVDAECSECGWYDRVDVKVRVRRDDQYDFFWECPECGAANEESA